MVRKSRTYLDTKDQDAIQDKKNKKKSIVIITNQQNLLGTL